MAPPVPLRKFKEAKNSKFELGLLDCYICQGHGREYTLLNIFSMRYNCKYIDIWDAGFLWTSALILQVIMGLHQGKILIVLNFHFL